MCIASAQQSHVLWTARAIAAGQDAKWRKSDARRMKFCSTAWGDIG